jgi:serine/threonine protein kinase/TolB-like protein/Tfp pilus assembly protein PilF
MEPERWQKIEDLLHAALACTPEQRAPFLARECNGDESLCREVESLISHYGKAADFLEASLPQVAAELLTGDQAPLAAGQTVGHYVVMAPLGTGGMGEVYLARDTRLERKIALKILPGAFASDSARSLRFEQEARAASALNHPNILTIHEIGQSGAIRFMTTEFVDGQTVRRLMQSGAMPLPRALDVACQVASALAAAHEAGIVHCDIKPDNVMLRQDGLVKVLDFGLAKLLEREAPADPNEPTLIDFRVGPGMIVGTPHYMSPEQARGQDLDARTDIFSLGVVLFEMITGRRPFDGATTSDVIAAILTREPPPLSRFAPAVPGELEQILRRSLARDREQRYRSSRDLLSDLRKLKQELEFRDRGERRDPEKHSVSIGPQDNLESVQGRLTAARRSLPRPSVVSSPAVNRGRFSRYMRLPAIGLLTVAVCVAAFYDSTGGSRGAGAVPSPVQPQIHSIVVLPLENLSRDPEQEYFADGMTDILITDLARIRSLRVISRNSAMHYKNVHKPLGEIARELNVDAVVAGTVARAGRHMRIDAQLIQAATDRHLWAESYTRNLKDVLKLQDEVSRDIANNIQVQLTPQEKGSLSRARPVNSEAYDAYLRGRYFMNKWSDQGYEKAADYFRQAIKSDPGYAPAYAELAFAWAAMAIRSSVPPAVGWGNAEESATRAVELDDAAALGHIALGCIKAYFHCDRPGAESEFKRAVELDPNSKEYFVYHSWFLLQSGQTEEALAEKRRDLALDPLSPLDSSELGIFLLRAHRTDEAIQHLQKTLEMDPNFPPTLGRLGFAYRQKKQYDLAASALGRAVDLDPTPQRLEGLADVLRESGRTQEAYYVLADLVGMAKRRYVPPDLIAGVYARLGDKKQALAWLQKASEDDLPDLSRRGFEGLRSDPRFRRLQERFKAARICW